MKYPNILRVEEVVESAKHCATGLPDGRYVPARMLGFQSVIYRWRAAWLVFTGRADALLWTEQ